MRTILALCLLLAVAGCASFEGRGLVPGQSTAADVERVMGTPAQLVIQLSPDGVVREVYLLDDSNRERDIIPRI